jgi:hypothetical protein
MKKQIEIIQNALNILSQEIVDNNYLVQELEDAFSKIHNGAREFNESLDKIKRLKRYKEEIYDQFEDRKKSIIPYEVFLDKCVKNLEEKQQKWQQTPSLISFEKNFELIVNYILKLVEGSKNISKSLDYESDCDSTKICFSENALNPWDIYNLVQDIARIYHLILKGQNESND